jgi:hypothetical protein
VLLADIAPDARQSLISLLHATAPASTDMQPEPTAPTAPSATVAPATSGDVEWSAPESPTEWARIFGVHYNTMIQWLKEQLICNEQVSPRRYRIAKDELPG